MRIFLTHSSINKDNSFKNTGEKVTPDKLYTSQRITKFMNTCKSKGVRWAIPSDFYGVWFPHIKHPWYKSNPDGVTEQELMNLLEDFDRKLENYTEIWFYHHPVYFHWLYKKLITKSRLKNKIKRFTSTNKIG